MAINMKHIRATALIIGSLALPACTSTYEFTQPSVQSIIQAGVNICGFAADNTGIESLIASQVLPWASTVEAWGGLVCSLVVKPAAGATKFGAPVPVTARGTYVTKTGAVIIITGKFIK